MTQNEYARAGAEHPVIEIAVQDVAGAVIALDEGAQRVELCSALVTGGLTPSIGLIEGVVQASRSGFVHVLIRPRPGGFVYDAQEIATSVRDIRAARAAGAGGVVVGALSENRTVDVAAIRTFVEAAEGMPVTFHRALDVVPDPLTALDELNALGITRVLTSGQAAASLDGLDMLARMVAHTQGAIQIMAGGGVTIAAIPALVRAGVDAIHLSAKTLAESSAPSGPGGGSTSYEVTSRELVRAAVRALRAE